MQLVDKNVSESRPVRADGVIQLAFDRFLLPSTITRQAVVLREASGAPVNPAPIVKYDPATRVVSLDNPNPNGGNWLVPGQSYTVTLAIPKGNEDDQGLRAIDRATVAPAAGGAPQVIGFKADDTLPVTPPSIMRFCNDVLPILQDRCSTSSCHGSVQGGSSPAAGLVLESWYGVQNTAIGRVAKASNTGSKSDPVAPGAIFGVNMPIIDPGNPGNSWLVYKLALAAPPAKPTDPPARVKCVAPPAGTPPDFRAPPPIGFAPAAVSPEEKSRLADFVPGREMPYPPGFEALSVDWQRRISAWIAQGARTADCSKCE